MSGTCKSFQLDAMEGEELVISFSFVSGMLFGLLLSMSLVTNS